MAKHVRWSYIHRLVKQLERADSLYYNTGKSPWSDSKYDRIKHELKTLSPHHSYLQKVGAPVKDEKEKVRLPIPMGSLRKTRPDDLGKFLKTVPKKYKGGFCVTPKLDGLSGELEYHNGAFVAAYTRGDGTEGRNVTSRARHISGVRLKSFRIPGKLYVKGEFVILNRVFNTQFKGRSIAGSDPYKNPRNFCVGMINRLDIGKEHIKALNKMMFVAFGITLVPNDDTPDKYIDFCKTKFGQLTLLKQLGFIPIDCPGYPGVEWNTERLDHLDTEWWEKHWKGQNRAVEYRKELGSTKSEKSNMVQVMFYHKDASSLTPQVLTNALTLNLRDIDILQDGLVLEVDWIDVQKKMGLETDGLTPKGAKAIKLSQEDQDFQVGRVLEVDWSYTKTRKFKPTVVLKKPLEFQGVEVDRAYAHNADYVREHGIGPGAKIKVIRSGDVIPYILGVTKSVEPQMPPKRCPHCNSKLKWTDVDLYCPNLDCEGVKVIQMTTACAILGVDNLGPGLIEQLYRAGYDSLGKILTAKEAELAKLKGWGDKRAKQVLTNLKKSLGGVKLAKLMHASGVFTNNVSSLGESKLQLIVDKVGALTVTGGDVSPTTLTSIHGIGMTGAYIYLDHIKEFRQWYRDLKKFVTLKDTQPVIKGPFTGQLIGFTGVRDKALSEKIEKLGGTTTDSYSKKVTTLIVPAKGHISTKTNKAKKDGVPVVPLADFKKQHNL